jgi:hypothetical protein
VNGSAWNGQPGTKPEAALCAEHNGHGKPFSAPKYQPGGEKYRKPVQPQEPSVDEQTAARVGAEILTGDAV